MKNGFNRVLAYKLSTIINDEDLSNVAGGSAQMSTRQTFQPTGSSAQGPDVHYDVSVDM